MNLRVKRKNAVYPAIIIMIHSLLCTTAGYKLYRKRDNIHPYNKLRPNKFYYDMTELRNLPATKIPPKRIKQLP